jgi:ParB family transcriptional regulator, chromosome partitioning protein
MADAIRLVEPRRLSPNPDNPRLIFHADELYQLEESIKLQGILVPLTAYEDGAKLFILDGERRWRCSVKLGLKHIPVNVQPKPSRLENIMMMFAIHNQRKDWDPLPSAYKLQQLEIEFAKRQGKPPTETQLAELASISRGEVRRLKNLLALPEKYRHELMDELEKPRSEQVITVDHVLEATRGAAALGKRGVIDAGEEELLRGAIIDKYRSRIIRNTVAPRQLARIARAVEREELRPAMARRVTMKLIEEPEYSIDDAFRGSIEQVDFEHSVEQLAVRLAEKLREHAEREYVVGEGVSDALSDLSKVIRQILRG